VVIFYYGTAATVKKCSFHYSMAEDLVILFYMFFHLSHLDHLWTAAIRRDRT